MIKLKKMANGFTMIEMIIVISITGIIAAVASSFIRRPIEAYEQTAKRAELADQAYLLVKKIKQDVRMSLPNSVRVSTSGNKIFLEVLTISNGGKYRVQQTSTNSGDILDFTIADSSFDVLSGSMTFNGGEKIVVANIGSPGFDAYSLDNMTNYVGLLNTAVSNIVITPKKFPLDSPNENFYVVNKVVSYVCDKDINTLTKYWGYAISGTQPTNTLSAPLSTASSALIADNIFDCNFAYNQGANSRNGIVSIWVKLKNKEQEATLFTDTYVKNI
jgi:MSHA biogenesis protein MshO